MSFHLTTSRDGLNEYEIMSKTQAPNKEISGQIEKSELLERLKVNIILLSITELVISNCVKFMLNVRQH